MRVRYLTVATLLLCTRAAMSQSAAEHVQVGDSLYQALRARQALWHYKAAIAVDSGDYAALWKASRTAIDLAGFEKDREKRTDMYRAGQRFALRAVAVNPGDAEGHFALARALGRVAMTVGNKERVRYAKRIRTQAVRALESNPEHAGALHVMGMWNAEIRRLSGLTRFFAKTFLGAGVFDSANWDDAVRYMEKAVEVDPARLVHRLSLGGIYADIGDKAKAREQYQFVINGRVMDYNDRYYKQQARRRLKALE